MLKIILLILLFCQIATAVDAQLSWIANTEADLAGYIVYQGTASGVYSSTPTQLGIQTTFTVTGLGVGTHYFALKAFDTSGNLSGFSNEVFKVVTSGGVPVSGLVTGYDLNETSGITITDKSGNGNIGITTGTTFVAGKNDGGLQFNGSSFVTISATAALNLTNDFTVSLWIKPTVANFSRGILTHNDNGDNGYTIAFDTNGFIRFPQFNAGASSNIIPNLNEWIHVTAIQEAGISKLYINGVLQSMTSPQVVESIPNSPLVLGRIYSLSSGFGFIGILDDVRIYSRVLTSTEILMDMGTGVSIDIIPPATPIGLTVQ